MSRNNNKFWTLIFGAILANSYVWLVNVGASTPVPELFHSYTAFVVDFYSPLVTALLSILLVIMISLIMLKGFKICVSEHILWLFWPSIGFLVFTSVTASALLFSILHAAIPALMALSMIYFIRKRQQFFLART
ncbi:hypothetical protein [Thalassotalea atypica]|uniref:hypothetical protein n=1 Tax=Thalassotalea atypica TaxID=2054316 RepID=UPI0025740DD5|nr:hypothetical protein [Thalassotalea atypica]